MSSFKDPASWSLAFKLARRELRGGFTGFRLMMACLALGVAAIAGIGSFSATIGESLQNDARALLGGDVELRLTHQKATVDQRAYLDKEGPVSAIATMRAMAATIGETPQRRLVELKAVDNAYPLYGEAKLDGQMTLDQALAQETRDGETIYGAVAQPDLFTLLKIQPGALVQVGEAKFVLRAQLLREPDAAGDVFKLGPSFITSEAGLTASKLEQPGSLIRYEYRVALPAGIDLAAWSKRITDAFPDAAWRIRTLDEGAPGIGQQLDRLNLFFTLIGLTALLVGGIGVANAVKSYLDGKTATIATFKCLGAPAGLIFRVYLLQIMVMALGGIAIGLLFGAVLPAAGLNAVRDGLGLDVHFGLHAQPLILAAAYGILTALTFALWPLARAREVPAAHLFRDLVSPDRVWPRAELIAATAVAALSLAALAFFTASQKNFAAWFILGAIVTLLVFRGLASVITRASRGLGHRLTGASTRLPLLNFALANLHRPGSPAGIILLSFGIGLTVFVTLMQIEGNLNAQISERLPAEAPSYFFVDIQPTQVEEFERIVSTAPGVTGHQRMPSLRARIVAIKGVEVDENNVAPEARWAVRSDRGLTYAARPPEGSKIVGGQWWAADYKGPPIISFDARVAQGMGIGVGDTLTFDILGRRITATIANLREINYQTLGLNFAIIFAPGVLEGAPQTHLSTVSAAPGADDAVREAVLSRFPNVTAINVKDALATAAEAFGKIADAARALASLALIAGVLVLAGAIAAGRRARIYDAVVLKVLGATRKNLLGAYIVEYAAIGLAASVIAGALGTLAGWLIVTQIMRAEWVFLPGTLIGTALVCTLAVVAFGFVGTWRALGQKASPILRAR
ncbi:MAG TPA: FtsX-like permease family protein [Alphaproteobacteria bacterium]|nr:FtsX-like permease family protein [Alphaproteobacteria bacterium]